MTLSDEILADFAKLLTEHGVTITWNGTDYLALASRVRTEQSLEIGGFVSLPDFTLRIPTNAFTNGLPKHGDLVEMEDDDYRVTKVGKHPSSPLITLEMIGANE